MRSIHRLRAEGGVHPARSHSKAFPVTAIGETAHRQPLAVHRVPLEARSAITKRRTELTGP